MAEKTIKSEAPVEKKSERQVRWEKYVENYIKLSPVKGAAKLARGEFNTIPDSFR